MIRLGNAQEFVEIRVVEAGAVGSQSEGDLRLEVSACADGFSGRYDQVWIGKEEWGSFMDSLARLERERKGVASLRSMSPDEFELKLEGVDRAGHLWAQGRLSRYHMGRSGMNRRSAVEYGFEVDPSMLGELVVAFGRLGSR